VLLVGESAPAGGTHFYFANSRLFSAVEEAARVMYGLLTPTGTRFLDFARERGLWLVDLADGPVNRLGRVDRRSFVQSGMSRVALQIREADPGFVVSLKATIAPTVADCVRRSGRSPVFVSLPFPVMQWRQPFVAGLAAVFRQADIQQPES
jgi:hypothetical protein